MLCGDKNKTTIVLSLPRIRTPKVTDQINDRELFMKGIDYSYYYEQED